MGRSDDVATTAEGVSARLAEGFGDYLRAQLRARRWTIRYLGFRAGVDHSTISRLIRAQRLPSLATVQRLEAALNGPTAMPIPVVRPVASTDPVGQVALALRRDPALDLRSVDRILRYYATVRSGQEQSPPR